ncbi:MAG: hypothetical protein WCI57_04035 [Candidatus Berkelbacteria bacterium]
MFEENDTSDVLNTEISTKDYLSVDSVEAAPFVVPDLGGPAVAEGSEAPLTNPEISPLPKSRPISKLLSIIIGASLLFLIIISIILTESGIVSFGFEKIYNKIGLEQVWGGLSETPSKAISRSFLAMSKQTDYQISGTFNLVASNSTQSKIISPLLSEFGQIIPLQDVSIGFSSNAILTASTAAAVSISSDVSEVDSGGSAVISWTSSDTTKCRTDWDGAMVATSGQVTITNIVYNRGFEITCVNGDDTLFDPVVPYSDNKVRSSLLIVAVKGDAPAPTPSMTLAADQMVITAGGAVTLTWSSTNTTGCAASWTASNSSAGSQTISGIKVGTAYSMVCTGAGGSLSKTVTIIVNNNVSTTPPVTSPGNSTPQPIVQTLYPSVTLSADNTYVDYGGSAVLTWSSKNASSCTAAWTKKTAQSGSETISSLVSEKTYSIICKSSDGNSSSNSVKIMVGPKTASGHVQSGSSTVSSAPPRIVLQGSSTTISLGGAVTLSWKAENADRCSAVWTDATSTYGSENVTPKTSGNYFLYCFAGSNKVKSNEISVTVNGAPGGLVAAEDNLQIFSTFSGMSTKSGTSVDFSVLDKIGEESILQAKNSAGNLWIKSDRVKFDEVAGLEKWTKYPFAGKDEKKYLDSALVSKATTFEFATGKRVGNEKCAETRCYHYNLSSIDAPSLADRFGLKESTIKNASGEIWIGISDKLIRKVSLNIYFVDSEPIKQGELVMNFDKFGQKNSFISPSPAESADSSL